MNVLRAMSRPRLLAVVAAALAVVMSLSAYGYYWKLESSIHHLDPDRLIEGGRPAKLNGAQNILMMGSDSRQGANAQFGRGLRNKAPASDTMILLHLSPGGGQAVGISFARDLMVPIPSCKREDGTRTQPSSLAMLNEAIGRGGPACTISTLEKLTRIKIDHFVQVDFVGFEKITKAVGGVPVCLPYDVNDPRSGLRLAKGPHNVQGKEALAYVRARHGFRDGSDTQRIKRQQRFLASLAKKGMNAGLLADPGRLNALLTSSLSSLTSDLRLTGMLKIAQSMRGLTTGKIRFVTVPDELYPPNHNRMQLAQPAASRFLDAVRDDRKIEAAPATPASPPARTKVRIFNASGVEGQAATVASFLKDRGYTVGKPGNLTRPSATTEIRAAASDAAQAKALAALIPGAKVRTVSSSPSSKGRVDVVLGSGFTGLKSAGIPNLTGEARADDDLCESSEAA
ncbi:LCP family protein [Actinomadura barringtoniae]|uniref:LCP family protein n=1 Tax=Actinomadura barringtoniae TaxID=1427535 RepID=A0A939PGH8_9ACTN|nr:LCP family protein [Actinomadura barringtoniae]MBO2451843.1 LCP family protein [Actinomadura barringtoniae]